MLLATPHDHTLAPAAIRPRLATRLGGGIRFSRRGVAVALLLLLALAPVCYVLLRTASARHNIVYWDEFDTALALVLKLKEGTTPGAFLHDLFAVSNEHRMVTSRLMFAISYWLTGTVNFAVIGFIGNASIVAFCGLLVVTAGSTLRRVRLGLLLSFLLFQLEHYENFLWSGSSIDHFQVVLLAAGAIVALARGTRAGVLTGGFIAALATFTLAHGLMIWPVGAAMLLNARDRRGVLMWGGMAALAVGAFLTGFTFNGAQSFAGVSADGALKIAQYWLSILGAVPALGNRTISPILGGVLLGLLALALRGGALQRERIVLPLAFFAVAAAGLIAIGRAEVAGGLVFSRYYVLSAVAWALALFMLLERTSHPRRPWRLLGIALPALIVFTSVANHEFTDETNSWLECRDRAATRFKQHGADGRGAFTLHPNPDHATRLLRRAEELGVYRLGPICFPRPFPKSATASERITYVVDEMTVSPRSAFVRGWAAIPGQRSLRGQIHVVLRSTRETHLFSAVTITRPDVAKGTNQPDWELAGFRFVRARDRLPTGDFQLGFLITERGKSEYIMTPHRLNLIGEGKAQLATGD